VVFVCLCCELLGQSGQLVHPRLFIFNTHAKLYILGQSNYLNTCTAVGRDICTRDVSSYVPNYLPVHKLDDSMWWEQGERC
jgi:hypothetical protein